MWHRAKGVYWCGVNTTCTREAHDSTVLILCMADLVKYCLNQLAQASSSYVRDQQLITRPSFVAGNWLKYLLCCGPF